MTIATGLYGLLTIISLGAVVVFAAIAFVYVRRLQKRPPVVMAKQVGPVPTVLRKVRKREPLSEDELVEAKQVIVARRSVMAYSIPAALFSVGCFFIFGSLEQLHGATPSERTFLGVFPMFTAANLAIQLLRSGRLKKRLQIRATNP
jgi:hypothetical protein